MKKVWLIPIVLACVCLCVLGVDLRSKAKIDKNAEKVPYYNNYLSRNHCHYALKQVINEDGIVVLGSSELAWPIELMSDDDLAFPQILFNGGHANYNMVVMGAGYTQSLLQAINLGALTNDIDNKKVAIILSPQWFTKRGLASEAFCSKFEEQNYVEFLKCKAISKTTKKAIAKRTKELLAADPIALDRVKKYEQVFLYGSRNLVKVIEVKSYNSFRNIKTRYETAKELEVFDSGADHESFVEAETLNWEFLMEQAEKAGEAACTTNELGIYDAYYNTYMKDVIASKKDTKTKSSFADSPEYDDFRLFLDVCRETGIKPLIISVPVNGRWYDYIGFPKDGRENCYQRIRDICNEYDVSLADFSDKEYELYFLRDIMHLGWKGWVYVDKAVYDFYKGENP